MSAIASPTYDQILDGMVSALAPLNIPSSGGPTSTQYLRFNRRYMGEKFDAEQFGERGGAGRMPGVFVAFAGEKPYRTTIGRRRDRVEGSFMAICVTDSRRSRDDRRSQFVPIYDVRKTLGDRKLGLAISPLRYAGVVPVAENDAVYAHGVRFTTRYSADYTISPGSDLLLGADGQIVYPPDGIPAAPTAPTVTVIGTAGTARYAYDVQALFAPGPASNFSAWAEIKTAPNTLSATNKLQITWTAQPGATGYVLRRRWAPTGVSIGVIFTGTATSFVDDGSVTATGGVLPARGINYHGAF